MVSKNIMSHVFSNVPGADMQRSTFKRHHRNPTTLDAAWLVPIFLDEVLPGDIFKLKCHAFARLATPITPVMDNMYMETFFFFVPNRLVWDNWQKFCGEQVDPGDTTDYVIPQVRIDAVEAVVGSITDYFGLPIGATMDGVTNDSNSVSALPFRAYNLIWNEWFRDQNLQPSVDVFKDDGPDDFTNNYFLLRRNKRHDYFTSCLPFPQKGDSIDLPLGASADVHTAVAEGVTMGVYSDAEAEYRAMATDTAVLNVDTTTAGAETGKLYADLSTATAATINQLRQAFQIQRLLERDARGGTRYTEIVRAHFGVVSPDARLQRPEFLGGGSSRVNITPVPQTSETGTTPQGNLAGFGTVSFSGGQHGFVRSFTEHGHIIGLVNVRADLIYQQRLDRLWTRQTRYDFYWPVLAHLGEQAVLSKEIFYGSAVEDEDVFGYQESFAEYRYKPSNITGLFRSVAAGSLDVWGLWQEFVTRPSLNSTFIQENPPIDRVIEVPSEPHFLFDSFFELECTRPMPLYGVPGLIDHF